MKFLNNLDLAQNELQNVRIQSLPSAPENPVAGQIYFDTNSDILRYYDGTSWTDIAETGGSGTPTGPAGGALSGSYPNPTLASGSVFTANIVDANVTDAKIDTVSASKVTGTADWMAQRFAADVGDGSATSIAVEHSLGTSDVVVQVYDKSDGSTVQVDSERTDANTVTLKFAVAPASDAYRCVIVA